jgi:Ni/Fe-hydrogenase subunit HybB-like protein
LQLALGLLWAYFIWTDFVIPWYGRMPWEILQIKLLYFKSYVWYFVVAFALCFISPLFLLMWTKLRRGRVGPFIVSSGVLIGLLADRIRLFSAAYSPKDITEDRLHVVPPTFTPGILDILIVVGAIAAAVALVMLAFRMIPVPSIWEMTEGTRLRAKRRYHNVEVMIIGKPDY